MAQAAATFGACIDSMSLSKRPAPVDDATPAAKRLRGNLRNLYGSNEISARRTQSFINDMHDANVRHVPGPRMKLTNKNLVRKLRKTMLGARWAPDHLAKVRVLSRFTQREEWQTVALQLLVATDPLKPKRGCCPNLFFRKSLNEMFVFLGVV